MKVEYINYPYVYTDTGQRLEISELDGTPRVGSDLVETDGKIKVLAVTSDSECVGNVCPIK